MRSQAIPSRRTIVQRAWSNRGLGDFWQHCLVAEGSVDVACDSVMQVWDYAPVQIVAWHEVKSFLNGNKGESLEVKSGETSKNFSIKYK